jgi:hypothetical protein
VNATRDIVTRRPDVELRWVDRPAPQPIAGNDVLGVRRVQLPDTGGPAVMIALVTRPTTAGSLAIVVDGRVRETLSASPSPDGLLLSVSGRDPDVRLRELEVLLVAGALPAVAIVDERAID